MDIKEIIGDYQGFYKDLIIQTGELGISTEDMPVSHICYRTTRWTEYETIRDQLKNFCSKYVENEYNGRAISMLLLETPLELAENRTVSLIELPAPRPAHIYPSGLEHVGFVVGEKFKEFKESYEKSFTGQKDRGPNCQPLFITFNNGQTIKFYERSLQEVVQLEGWRFKPIT